MAKQSPHFALALPDREPGAPAILWLYKVLRQGILDRRLTPGTRLPATRELARHYRLARGTIVQAFEQLKAEGYLRAGVGSGTYVTSVIPDRLLQAGGGKRASAGSQRSPPRRLSEYGRKAQPYREEQSGPVRAFHANQPALDLFPTTLWARIASRRLRMATMQQLRGSHPMGYRPLQDAVAEYLRTSRGVRCQAPQIAIISGVQEALDLVARMFLDPGDRVAMESPGYPGASRVFEAYGGTVVPMRIDQEGMVVSDALDGARLVYVTPAHQFPLGVSMSLSRRLALLEWARRSGAVIFEDDYDSEYRYAGRPVPALQGLDRHDLVIFAGSFSKVMFSALRLGYVVIPEDLMDRFAAALSITTLHAPLLDQVVLTDFISAGHFGRHIRRMRGVYAERLGTLLESAGRELAGLLTISEVEAGLQTVGWLQGAMDGNAAARAAAKRDVEVNPLSRYGRGRGLAKGLQLGFAAVDVLEIRRGVRDLASALTGS